MNGEDKSENNFENKKSTGEQQMSEFENTDLQEFQAQAEKFKNEYLYLRAEFDNYKKNAIKERSDLVKFGSERLIVEILGVIDNFERALETKVTSDNLETFVKGVQMTAAEMKALVIRFGVSEIPTQGQAFDPMIHEALGAEESDTVEPGFISKVFKKAYKMYDKVIRPAQVIVAKAKNV
jgi:molecular chaperone GrpE